MFLVVLGEVAVPDAGYFGKLVSRQRISRGPTHALEKGFESGREVVVVCFGRGGPNRA